MTIKLMVEMEVDVDPRVHELSGAEQMSVEESVEMAVRDALKFHEEMGFNHPLGAYISLEAGDVKVVESGY